MNDVVYQWTPEDKFEFEGVEFSVLVNALRDFLNTESSQKVLMVKAAFEVVEKKLKEGVDSGVIKTGPTPEQN